MKGRPNESASARHSIYHAGGRYIKLSLAKCRELLDMPALQWEDLTAERRQVLQEIYRINQTTGGAQ